MDSDDFDEATFFEALRESRVRYMLIGRRALVALGAPVLTSDYDLWIHIDDIDALNRSLAPLDLEPTYTADVARQRGRYVLEGPEHVDVMVARAKSTKDGVNLTFDDAYSRRQTVRGPTGIEVVIPSIDDLIQTKRWAMRPKDLPDIQLLERLKRRGSP